MHSSHEESTSAPESRSTTVLPGTGYFQGCRPLFALCWLLLGLPALVHAQFKFTTNNGTITITGYTGPGGVVEIPSTITGLPVSSIGTYAFVLNNKVTELLTPDTV